MTLQISLPAELEDRLRHEAQRQGLTPDAVTLKLLEEHLPAVAAGEDFAATLQRWQAEDEAMTEEESAANADVLRAIDENRLSDRKLFTDILKNERP